MDLIDRQAVLKNIEKIRQGVQMMDDTRRASIIMNGMYLCEKAVRNQPSAHPEMVKCKKCRYVHYDKEFVNYWCDRMSDPFKVEADGYCKWGK